MSIVQEFQIKNTNKKLQIYYDEYADTPREWDNLGNMVCFHNRYNLGDKHNFSTDDFDSWEDMENYLLKNLDIAVIMPLYLYDHGGITMNTSSFHCRWDSGQVGFIYATKEEVRKWFDTKKVTQKYLEKTKECLQYEVETYSRYIEGEVYGFKLSEGEEELDSCCGFYGYDIKENGILDHAGVDFEQLIEVA